MGQLTNRETGRPTQGGRSLARNGMSLAMWIGICLAAMAAGSAVTFPRIDDWYAALAKPAWTPQAWVFGPVWTTLYLSMAVSAWLVERQGGRRAGAALALFALQLGMNVAWSWLFFGLGSPGAALAHIALLWIAIAATVVAFWRSTMVAGVLLLPYLAWVGFAAVLNLAIWRMNA